MNTEAVSNLQQLLSTPKNIVVVGHKNPDGDAIGSTLGLSIYLKKKGHKVQVIMPNDFPKFLKWMPESDSIMLYDREIKNSDILLNEADIIFTLDFNSLTRVGMMENSLRVSKAIFIMIDHHQQPDDYAEIIYSDVSMCSTAQMVYHFIDSLDGLPLIDQAIATNLYVGIMTDTGSFRYSSTTSLTHRVIADLIDKGASNSTIHQNIYDTNSPNRMKLLGVALKNLVINPSKKTAYITLSQEELDTHKFQKGDTEGFVNYALSIEGIIFAAIFIESKNEGIIKISFRSKGNFSVNDFARNHYEGGGHINAAGGRSQLSLNKTISEFNSILASYQNALINA